MPLGEYVGGKIYRGIKTGLNEAFVIDAETKEKLIAEDPKSAELIKPFLVGRDIKRYNRRRAINTCFMYHGISPCRRTQRIKGASTWEEEAFKSQYPSVYSHLLKYKPLLAKRNAARLA